MTANVCTAECPDVDPPGGCPYAPGACTTAAPTEADWIARCEYLNRQMGLHPRTNLPGGPELIIGDRPKVTAVRDPDSGKTLGHIVGPFGKGEHAVVADPAPLLIDLLRDAQAAACPYGTREGDGQRCDCKYDLLRAFVPNDVARPRRSEATGCPELRAAIRVLDVTADESPCPGCGVPWFTHTCHRRTQP